jgi:hypothetical protein
MKCDFFFYRKNKIKSEKFQNSKKFKYFVYYLDDVEWKKFGCRIDGFIISMGISVWDFLLLRFNARFEILLLVFHKMKILKMIRLLVLIVNYYKLLNGESENLDTCH